MGQFRLSQELFVVVLTKFTPVAKVAAAAWLIINCKDFLWFLKSFYQRSGYLFILH